MAAAGLSSDLIARIVKRRATGRSRRRLGFVTEAGRQGVPLGEVRAMTEHRSASTVMGYFQAGSLLGTN